MWIKVTEPNDRDVFINCDNVDLIIPTDEGCNILFSTSEIPLRVKTTFAELDRFLDVNSTEKYIDKLKQENFQLALRESYDKTLGVMINNDQRKAD